MAVKDWRQVQNLFIDLLKISGMLKSLDILVHDHRIMVNEEQYGLIEEDSYTVARQSLRVAEWLAATASLTDDIVRELENRIKDIGTEIKNRYGAKGITIHEMARANDIARRDICVLLAEIRKNNGGQMPQHLDREWKNLQCSTYRLV